MGFFKKFISAFTCCFGGESKQRKGADNSQTTVEYKGPARPEPQVNMGFFKKFISAFTCCFGGADEYGADNSKTTIRSKGPARPEPQVSRIKKLPARKLTGTKHTVSHTSAPRQLGLSKSELALLAEYDWKLEDERISREWAASWPNEVARQARADQRCDFCVFGIWRLAFGVLWLQYDMCTSTPSFPFLLPTSTSALRVLDIPAAEDRIFPTASLSTWPNEVALDAFRRRRDDDLNNIHTLISNV